MPWTGASFKSKHNKGLSDDEADAAAAQANAILKRTGDEALAIRTANASAKRKRKGKAKTPKGRAGYASKPIAPPRAGALRSYGGKSWSPFGIGS